jgi:DNA-directed RNA polymerase subunit L
MFSKLNIINKEKTTFEINNNGDIKISLINGIKRTIYGKIPVYAIDRDSINFIINTTTFDNSFLTLRLTLLPIKCDLENFNYDDTLITFKYKNNDDIINSYYCKDFICEDNNLFAYKDTLFTKIKPKQELEFTCKLKKGITLTNNATFCAVCNASYKFKLDEKAINEATKNMDDSEKQSFNTLEAKRLYLKNKDDQPSIYIYSLENCGNYDNKTIMNYGFDILILQLKSLGKSFKENDKNKFTIKKADAKMDCYDMIILDENDTIGNLLTTYLLDDKNITYASYKIPHPLHNKLLIRISSKDNTIENIMNIIDKTIEKIKK